MVEFGVMAPVLVLILGGIMYCGAMVVQQERLAVVARMVARAEALDATKRGLSQGVGAPASATVRTSALSAAGMAGRDTTIKSVNWSGLGRMASGPGSLRAVNGYTGMYVATKRIALPANPKGQAKSYDFGLGVVFHGATIERDARTLSPLAKLANLTPFGAGASSVMPAELPPRGTQGVQGVLDLNNWITDIVNEPIPDR